MSVNPELRAAFGAFGRTLAAVEGGKESLAAAAPRGRGSGVPLAEALAGFEEGLSQAEASMAAWRREEVTDVWDRCARSLRESERRAERLRLGSAPQGYDQLYGVLGELMEPLDAFGAALDRFRRLGV